MADLMKGPECHCPTKKRGVPCFGLIFFSLAVVLMLLSFVITQLTIWFAETPDDISAAYRTEVVEELRPLNDFWVQAQEELTELADANPNEQRTTTDPAPIFTETENLYRLTEAYQYIAIPAWMPKEDRQTLAVALDHYYAAALSLWHVGRAYAELRETGGHKSGDANNNIAAQLAEAEQEKQAADALLQVLHQTYGQPDSLS